MNVIFLSRTSGTSRSVSLPRHLLLVAVMGLAVVPVLFGTAGYYVALYFDSPIFSPSIAQTWADDIDQQKHTLKEVSRNTEERLSALTIRMAEMQARLVRLDALGERLTELANIHGDEFNFVSLPAVGGPEVNEDLGEAYKRPSFLTALDTLSNSIEEREQQLDVLESLIEGKKQRDEVFLAGRPITRGWMSSRYGARTDPISGRRAMHKGVDFAAVEGSDILATASGVVTMAGNRKGYGLMVEVSHGDGFSTRYAHAKEVKVVVGEIVRTGQVIAKVGNSGRSTGPHVHYEVLKSNGQIDPASYINRSRRS